VALVCTIELDKEKGITIEVTGGDSAQKVTIDSGKIELKSGETTLTLDKSSIEWKTGQSTIKQDAQGITISCPKLTVKATQSVEVKGMSLQLEADGIATLKGNMTNVQGSLVKLG
jgi:lipopolysaccharide export system protein LptA